MIKALYLSDRAINPKVILLDPDDKKHLLYEQIQRYTKGVFTAVHPDDYDDTDVLKDYVIYANDKGLFLDGMEQNVVMQPELIKEGRPFLAGILYGPILIVKPNRATGDEVTLDSDEIPLLTAAIKEKMLLNVHREGLMERGAKWIK